MIKELLILIQLKMSFPKSIVFLLGNFTQTTSEDVRKVITSMSTATCDLDPIPTNILKSFCDKLLPVITDKVNLFLQNGQVPSDLKRAII